jgi:hypothetical protein
MATVAPSDEFSSPPSSSFLFEYSSYLVAFLVLVVSVVGAFLFYKRWEKSSTKESSSAPGFSSALQSPLHSPPLSPVPETRQRSSSLGNKNPDQNKWLKQKIVLEQLKKHCAKENIVLELDTEENLLQKNEKIIEIAHSTWDYPFDVMDSPWNILYTNDEHGNRIVRGATLVKIVEKLTDDISTLSIQYVAPFLLTYRSFCTATQLWDLLYKR